jgi:magnesium transporter
VGIESTVYRQGRGSVPASFAEALQACRERGNLAWISLVEPDENDFGVISSNLGLEPRLLKEAARFPHRSGVERHETRLVAVLPILRNPDEVDGAAKVGGLRSIESDWVLALAAKEPNMIVTLTDGDRVVLDKMRRRVEERPDLLTRDSETILLEMVGEVVGDYEHAAGVIDACIRRAEVTVMEGRSRDMVRQIHTFTSQAVELQQAIMPLASALEQLVGVDAPLAHRQLSRIRHRALRVAEELDGARARLSSLLQVNLTVVGQKISAWGAILIAPSLIAGVFGMNFEGAWLTKADHGFEVMLVIMFLVSGSLYVWFRRSGWL